MAVPIADAVVRAVGRSIARGPATSAIAAVRRAALQCSIGSLSGPVVQAAGAGLAALADARETHRTMSSGIAACSARQAICFTSVAAAGMRGAGFARALTVAGAVGLQTVAAAGRARLGSRRVGAAGGVLPVTLAATDGVRAFARGALAARRAAEGRAGSVRAVHVAGFALLLAKLVTAEAVHAEAGLAVESVRARHPDRHRSGAFVVDTPSALAVARFRAALTVC